MRLAALAAALAAAGCAALTPNTGTPPVPRVEPSYSCDVCGDEVQNPGKIFRLEAPAAIKAGKPATFTVYVALGLDKLLVCDAPAAKVEDPDWGPNAAGDAYTFGLMVKAVQRDESKPCMFIDRATPPQAKVVKKTVTFAKAGTYALTVVGWDRSRPLGMTWSPGPEDPPYPPAPSVPATIEVAP